MLAPSECEIPHKYFSFTLPSLFIELMIAPHHGAPPVKHIKRKFSGQLRYVLPRTGDVPFAKYLALRCMLTSMIKYLEKMEIVEINRNTLELHGELEDFHLMMPSDLEFIVDFVKNNINECLYNKALAYCVSLILLHPFKNGNHRTSIYAAEMFLIENGYNFVGNIEHHKELQKWRFDYEEAHDMETRFARIMAHDNHKVFIKEIKTIMDEEYGKKILNWLKQNYK